MFLLYLGKLVPLTHITIYCYSTAMIFLLYLGKLVPLTHIRRINLYWYYNIGIPLSRAVRLRVSPSPSRKLSLQYSWFSWRLLWPLFAPSASLVEVNQAILAWSFVSVDKDFIYRYLYCKFLKTIISANFLVSRQLF